MNRAELTIERNTLGSLVLSLMICMAMVWKVFDASLESDALSIRMVEIGMVLERVSDLREDLLDVETGERGYIITGNPSYLAPHESALNEMESHVVRLKSLLGHTTFRQEKFAELSEHIERKIAVSRISVAARAQGFLAAQKLVEQGDGKREMDAIRRLLDELEETTTKEREVLSVQNDAAMNIERRDIGVAALLMFCGLLFFHFRFQRLMKQRHAAEQHVQHLAAHDGLTGLANRRLMLEHVERGLQRSMRQKQSLALLFLDLNGFKPVNDKYGHHAGDEVLQQVAQRLSAVMRGSDRVARFGGDEFVVLVEDISDKKDVCGIVGKIEAEIARPFLLTGGDEVGISTSIGVAIYPYDGEDMETLLRNADTAMYAAKSKQSNCFCFEQKNLCRYVTPDGETK